MALRYCSGCGKEVPDNAAFCPHCGHAVMPAGGASPAAAPPVAASPAAAPPVAAPVVVQKNSHPILTAIGGIAVVLMGIGFVANLMDDSAPASSARFIATDVLSDENCTQLGDYCLQVHCTYQNTGDAAGERQVRARLLAMDSDAILADHTSMLTLLPGATQRVTFAFPEANIDVKTRAQCGVDEAP
jgi:hypothetical protein